MSELGRYNIDSNKEKDSRYRLLDRIKYDDGTVIIETQDRIVIPQSTEDRYFIIDSGMEGRLDLVSYKYYGTPLYWWCIAAASGINDPLSVKIGDKLRIPPLATVVALKGVVL